MALETTNQGVAQPEQPAQAHVSASQGTVTQQPVCLIQHPPMAQTDLSQQTSAKQNMDFQEAKVEEPKVSMRGGGCIADW